MAAARVGQHDAVGDVQAPGVEQDDVSPKLAFDEDVDRSVEDKLGQVSSNLEVIVHGGHVFGETEVEPRTGLIPVM